MIAIDANLLRSAKIDLHNALVDLGLAIAEADGLLGANERLRSEPETAKVVTHLSG